MCFGYGGINCFNVYDCPQSVRRSFVELKRTPIISSAQSCLWIQASVSLIIRCTSGPLTQISFNKRIANLTYNTGQVYLIHTKKKRISDTTSCRERPRHTLYESYVTLSLLSRALISKTLTSSLEDISPLTTTVRLFTPLHLKLINSSEHRKQRVMKLLHPEVLILLCKQRKRSDRTYISWAFFLRPTQLFRVFVNISILDVHLLRVALFFGP